MARDENKRRPDKFDPRSFASDPDFAKMLRELGIGAVGKDIGMVPKKAVTSGLLDEWQDAIGGLISGHSVDKRGRG